MHEDIPVSDQNSAINEEISGDLLRICLTTGSLDAENPCSARVFGQILAERMGFEPT
jgi:hypothetical protein